MVTLAKAKMLRYEHILMLVCLSRAGCQPPTDLSQNKECDRYRIIANVRVRQQMCFKSMSGATTDKRNSMVCVQKCNAMKQVSVPTQSSFQI